MQRPVIISAYAGDVYYYESAAKLRKDCERFGLSHDIVELQLNADDDWAKICRKKLAFIRERAEHHQAPVLWVDVDTRIIAPPTFLDGLNCDFGAFIRGFRYIRDFDPEQYPRFFAPTILFFGRTEKARGFLDLMVQLEQANTDLSATDDFFLEEAWRQHSEQLDVTIFSPRHIKIPNRPFDPKASLQMGVSGNVKHYIRSVEQHGARNVSAARKTQVINQLAVDARTEKDMTSAAFLANLALKIDPSNQDAVIELSKTFPAKEKAGATRELMQRFQENWSGSLRAKRRWVDIELQSGDLSVARQVCESLLESTEGADRDFALSRIARIELDERARQMGLSKDQRPNLWWMENPYPGNFGDTLNPYIVEKLTGLPPLFVPAGKGSLVIGSIIKFAREGTKVWGAGTPRMTDELSPDADYRAVRGPRTRQLVLQSGGWVDEVFGDAAAFLPTIYWPAVEKTHAVGLVRHLSHQDRSLTLDGVRDIDIRRVGYAAIEAFIRELLSCERIISTSLHGLIVAHAYGIPAEWGQFKDEGLQPAGDDTKFLDYFESVGIKPHQAIDLSGSATLSESISRQILRLPDRPTDLRKLAAVSPFTLKRVA